MTRSPTYNSWRNMKQRCLNSRNPRYGSYGGRGITICARWLKFENFLADMGERPSGLSLERKRNSKGYSKSNCVWADASQQNYNRRPMPSARLYKGYDANYWMGVWGTSRSTTYRRMGSST